MIRAVYTRQILWPQMQEDRDEGGWGRSGRKKRLKASLVPPDQQIPEEAAIHPVAIGAMASSGVPVIGAVNEKGEEPGTV